MKANIIIVGVGGQGILLTSKILGYLALKMGDDVKVSEVHGMSQRGGSVITHVRIGENVASPLVTPGEADMVIAFEWLEALRSEFYLRQGGAMIANTHRMLPMPVIMGKAAIPSRQSTGIRSTRWTRRSWPSAAAACARSILCCWAYCPSCFPGQPRHMRRPSPPA